MSEDLTRIWLVPVEVFGGCDHPGCEDDRCWSFGLADAVSAWSDCNRAEGRIYRVEDLGDGDGAKYREPGEVLALDVTPAQLAWFQRRWGDRWASNPNGPLAADPASASTPASTPNGPLTCDVAGLAPEPLAPPASPPGTQP